MRCLEVGIMDLVRVVAYSVDRISTESDIFQLLMSVSELSIAHSSFVRTKPGQERRLIRRDSTYKTRTVPVKPGQDSKPIEIPGQQNLDYSSQNYIQGRLAHLHSYQLLGNCNSEFGHYFNTQRNTNPF